MPRTGSRIPNPRAESSSVGASPYDAIARLYDPWSRTVTEDVSFYVQEAEQAESPVVELGVGTGRIAIPIARAGVRVIGVDSSAGMLAVCRAEAEHAGVAGLEVEALYGGFAREPFTADSREFVWVTWKPQ